MSHVPDATLRAALRDLAEQWSATLPAAGAAMAATARRAWRLRVGAAAASAVLLGSLGGAVAAAGTSSYDGSVPPRIHVEASPAPVGALPGRPAGRPAGR